MKILKRPLRKLLKKPPIILTLLIALAFNSIHCSADKPKPELIISGGTIYTLFDRNPTVEALLIRGEKIVYIGTLDGAKSWASSEAQIIDLKGGIAIPGLIDAHGHLNNLGKFLSQLDLKATKSNQEVRQIVLDALPSAPEDSWIQGRGWDQNDWQNDVSQKKEYPNTKDLEGTNSHPVYLRRVDGHACWVNKRALEICGITSATPDPPGGQILRDNDGNPTGIFIDNAEDLIAAHVEIPTQAERDAWISKAIKECNKLGLVGVHDPGVNASMLQSFKNIANQDNLTLRINAMLSANDSELLTSYFASGPTTEASDMVRVASIKVYADGSLGSRGAWLLEPYSDKPNHSGFAVTTPDSILTLTKKALAAGFQVCTHAIGDKGVRETLNAYQTALEESGESDARLRIEHSQVIAIEDIPRFAQLGIIPAMQPTHCTSDMYWAEDRIGPERIAGAYAWRALINNGSRIPLGSDFPVESANPLWGIYAAVTRQDHKSWPEGGWRPQEALTVEEAVRGFTTDAVYAEFAEKTRGILQVGKIADITILNKDIFKIEPSEILQTNAQYTIVAGKIVYSANDPKN